LRVLLFVLILPILLFSEDFISEFEYGQMLYKDPRGVSCASCHGDLGEGAFIASFIDAKGNIQKFYGPDIRNLNLKTFRHRVSRGGKIMPKFYLTNKEVEAIYKYIKIVNSNNKDKELEDSDNNATNDNIPEIVVDDNYTLEDNTTGQSNNTILGKIFKTKEDEQEK